jgi:membrane fusion protein (multidrug efflux system)
MRIARRWLPVLSALAVAGCDAEETQRVNSGDTPLPTVGVVPAQRREITPTFELVGRIEAINSVELRARVEGFLEERRYTEGGKVEEGQVLFAIEKAPYVEEVNRLQATVERAEATLKLAALDRGRKETLVKRQAVAAAQLDDALAKEAEALADLKRQRAELEKAQLNLQYTEVKAPFAGRIGKAAYSEGSLVNPQSGTLARLVQLHPIYATVNLSERVLLAFRRGTVNAQYEPRLQLSDGELYGETGDWAFFEPSVDTGTDTVPVRAIFDNEDSVLLPGQFVTVVLQQAEAVSALTVPQRAIQEDQSGRFVLTVDEASLVQVTRVETGDQEGVDWVIEAGLEEGQVVIVQGLQKVRPGIAVNAVREQQAVDQPAGGG